MASRVYPGWISLRTAIVIADDFYSDAMSIRRAALSLRYYFPYQRNADVDAGRARISWMSSWFRPAARCPFKSSSVLIARLEHLTGERIDLAHWNLDFPTDEEGKPARDYGSHERSCLWNCSFHLKTENEQPLGEGVHNHVTDGWNSVGENGWTGLIYLNVDAPLSGGLKLFRNIEFRRRFDWMTPRENWELIDDLGNVFNRLILVRGDIPHSGAAGWGDSLESGRLYQTFFFKTKRARLFAGVRLEDVSYHAAAGQPA